MLDDASQQYTQQCGTTCDGKGEPKVRLSIKRCACWPKDEQAKRRYMFQPKPDGPLAYVVLVFTPLPHLLAVCRPVAVPDDH